MIKLLFICQNIPFKFVLLAGSCLNILLNVTSILMLLNLLKRLKNTVNIKQVHLCQSMTFRQMLSSDRFPKISKFSLEAPGIGIIFSAGMMGQLGLINGLGINGTKENLLH